MARIEHVHILERFVIGKRRHAASRRLSASPLWDRSTPNFISFLYLFFSIRWLFSKRYKTVPSPLKCACSTPSSRKCRRLSTEVRRFVVPCTGRRSSGQEDSRHTVYRRAMNCGYRMLHRGNRFLRFFGGLGLKYLVSSGGGLNGFRDFGCPGNKTLEVHLRQGSATYDSLSI